MKLKTTLIAALSLACTAISQAFIIDFNGLTPTDEFELGTVISQGQTLEIEVAGYGIVTIEAVVGDVEVGNSYQRGGSQVNSLEFGSNDQVLVTLTGPVATAPGSVDIGTVGETQTAPVDEFTIQENVVLEQYQITLIGAVGSNGAGIDYIAWDVVPEPSSAALGALGMSMILLRRRRA